MLLQVRTFIDATKKIVRGTSKQCLYGVQQTSREWMDFDFECAHYCCEKQFAKRPTRQLGLGCSSEAPGPRT